MESEEPVDFSEDPAAEMAELERFRDLAPSEIRDDIDAIIDVFNEVAALEANGDGEENFEAIFELAFDPEIVAASENIEQFGVEECGLEPSAEDDEFSFDESDDEQSSDRAVADDADQASADDGAAPADGLVTEPADVPDPLYDPFFDDEPLDLGELSIDGLQYFMDVNYTDAPWRTRLGSWFVLGAGSGEVGVGGLDVTESEATEICSAVVEYMRSLDAEGTIVVSTYGQDENGLFGEEEDVLRTTVSDGC